MCLWTLFDDSLWLSSRGLIDWDYSVCHFGRAAAGGEYLAYELLDKPACAPFDLPAYLLRLACRLHRTRPLWSLLIGYFLTFMASWRTILVDSRLLSVSLAWLWVWVRVWLVHLQPSNPLESRTAAIFVVPFNLALYLILFFSMNLLLSDLFYLQDGRAVAVQIVGVLHHDQVLFEYLLHDLLSVRPLLIADVLTLLCKPLQKRRRRSC